MEFGPFWQEMRHGLVTAVEAYEPRDCERECWIWMMAMAVCAFIQRTGLQEPGRRLLDLLQAGVFRQRSRSELNESLGRFLWTESLDMDLHRYWKHDFMAHEQEQVKTPVLEK